MLATSTRTPSSRTNGLVDGLDEPGNPYLSAPRIDFGMTRLFALAFACLASLQATKGVSSDSSDPGVEFFEKKIRPVLAEHCHKCHSHNAEKLKAGLYLDIRDGFLKGGDTGVAVALGEPEKSRFIEAVRY